MNSLLPAGSGVAFFAVMSNLSYNTTANQDLKFDKVITNIGGAFNTNSSLFVATIPGVYVFRYMYDNVFDVIFQVKNLKVSK